MHSSLYHGVLRHRRFAPRKHAFSYRLFMMYIDLSELEEIFRDRWLWSTRWPAPAWLRRADYLGDAAKSIDEAVRDRVEAAGAARPRGPVCMLTHLRYFGVGFNPVTFYYCFDPQGQEVEAIVAEITNTPWKERHAYVLTRPQGGTAATSVSHRFEKAFHVSPFMPMQQDYDWRFSSPGARLAVHMQNLQGGARVFDATLQLERREIGAASLARALVQFPLMTAHALGAIYWQALRLRLKQIPFHAHPRSLHVSSR